MIVDMRIDMTMLDDDFFEELDEIMDDTMIAIFMLHPKDNQEVRRAQLLCQEHKPLFYALPYEYAAFVDENCKAMTLNKALSPTQLESLEFPLLIHAEIVDETFAASLRQSSAKGAILHAHKNFGIANFYEGMTNKRLLDFSKQDLEAIDMTHIVLHSNYPHQSFESIHETAKAISDAIFRPDESIKNHATRNALSLLGLR